LTLGAKGTSAVKMLSMLKKVKEEVRKAGLKLLGLATDMGSENLAMWALLGIFATRDDDCCTVPSLADEGEVFIVMPDPPHGLKNIKSASIKYKIKMPAWFFTENNLEDLPLDTLVDVRFCLLRLIKLQEVATLVFVPGLNYSHVFPNNWQKMRMPFTLKVISDKVVAAIETCVELGMHCFTPL
jgi:hypothetical protein